MGINILLAGNIEEEQSSYSWIGLSILGISDVMFSFTSGDNQKIVFHIMSFLYREKVRRWNCSLKLLGFQTATRQK